MTTPLPWLPLLRRLTAEVPSWAVWKGAPELHSGTGDVDSVCAAEELPLAIAAFRRWADAEGHGPVILCGHFPGLKIAVACAGERPMYLRQLDLYERHVFRGATLVEAAQLRPLLVENRNYRRLRGGAEGLLRLVLGARRGGGAPSAQAREEAVALIRSDREGAASLAGLLGLAVGAVDAAARGGWDQRALLALERRSIRRLLTDPRELSAAVARDYRRVRGCLLVKSLEQGRIVLGDPRAWLEEMAATHELL
jgi:hypothetical protein